MKKETKAIYKMLLCATLWSIAGIFIKQIPWSGFTIAGIRSLIAGLTIFAYMKIRRYKFSVNRKTLLSGLLTACVYTCFVCANKLTTSANAIVLQFTSPAFIVVFSALFLKTAVRRADVLVVLFTLLGISLFFLDQLAPGYVLGNFVAIAAGMFMAGMFICVGNLQGEERFSAIVIGQLITFLIGSPSFAKSLVSGSFTLSPVIIVSILALGIFQLGISYVLYVEASEFCPPLACCLLGAVEPLLNPVWVLIFNGEKPGPFALIGGIIVISSITIWCVHDARKEAQSES